MKCQVIYLQVSPEPEVGSREDVGRWHIIVVVVVAIILVWIRTENWAFICLAQICLGLVLYKLSADLFTIFLPFFTSVLIVFLYQLRCL